MIDRLSNLFKVLSDETRLKIISLLSEGTLCVNEIVKNINTTQPNASFHLRILLGAGIVSGRQIGKNIHYYLDPDDMFTRFIIFGICERLRNKDLQEKTNINGFKKCRFKRREIISKEENMNTKGRGFCHGQGAGGPAFNCVCNKCGTKLPHTPGIPCRQEKCPKCGGPMVREGSPHDRTSGKESGENKDE